MSATALNLVDRRNVIGSSGRALDRLLRALRLMGMNDHEETGEVECEREEDYEDSDTHVPPDDNDRAIFERLTKGDVKILVAALRIVVRQEVRRESRATLMWFVNDKWNQFGKYSAKGIWAAILAALLYIAIITHGFRGPPK